MVKEPFRYKISVKKGATQQERTAFYELLVGLGKNPNYAHAAAFVPGAVFYAIPADQVHTYRMALRLRCLQDVVRIWR